MLLKAAKGIHTHDTDTTKPYPSFPTNFAINGERIIITIQIAIERIKLDQNATEVDLYKSSFEVNCF